MEIVSVPVVNGRMLKLEIANHVLMANITAQNCNSAFHQRKNLKFVKMVKFLIIIMYVVQLIMPMAGLMIKVIAKIHVSAL